MGDLSAAGLKQERFGGAVNVGITLNAALRIEQEARIPVPVGKALNCVCDHSIRPANAVVPGYFEIGLVAEVVEACGSCKRGKLLIQSAENAGGKRALVVDACGSRDAEMRGKRRFQRWIGYGLQRSVHGKGHRKIIVSQEKGNE